MTAVTHDAHEAHATLGGDPFPVRWLVGYGGHDGSDPAQAGPAYAARRRSRFQRQLWRSACLAALATNPALARFAREGLRRAPSLFALAARG